MKQKLLFSITILFFFTNGFAQQNTLNTTGSAINSTVINIYGEVIGVAVTIIKKDVNFNFAIPIAYLKAL